MVVYVVLDAGCGAAHTALQYFKPVLNDILYIGSDISEAVDVAKAVDEEKANAAFLPQYEDLNKLPIPNESLDVIFSEGVFHHTD